jgi:hypothetical protein
MEDLENFKDWVSISFWDYFLPESANVIVTKDIFCHSVTDSHSVSQ